MTARDTALADARDALQRMKAKTPAAEFAAVPILEALHDTDYRAQAERYYDVAAALLPADEFALFVCDRRLDEWADAGRWDVVACRLFDLLDEKGYMVGNIV